MSDLLNNLIETEVPEVGGYYRAGNDDTWDEGLTEGKLYLIESVETEEDFYVADDDGDSAWVSTDGITYYSNGGKLYANPANKA